MPPGQRVQVNGLRWRMVSLALLDVLRRFGPATVVRSCSEMPLFRPGNAPRSAMGSVPIKSVNLNSLPCHKIDKGSLTPEYPESARLGFIAPGRRGGPWIVWSVLDREHYRLRFMPGLGFALSGSSIALPSGLGWEDAGLLGLHGPAVARQGRLAGARSSLGPSRSGFGAGDRNRGFRRLRLPCGKDGLGSFLALVVEVGDHVIDDGRHRRMFGKQVGRRLPGKGVEASAYRRGRHPAIGHISLRDPSRVARRP